MTNLLEEAKIMANKRFLPPLIFLIMLNSLCFGANNYNSQKIETIVKDQANYLNFRRQEMHIIY
jgi:hypothetical protein